MITIQELHRYNKLCEAGVAPVLPCPIDNEHGHMTPWADENDAACFWCLACDAKSYLGYDQIVYIKSLLRP